jgi:hypothetical protein
MIIIFQRGKRATGSFGASKPHYNTIVRKLSTVHDIMIIVVKQEDESYIFPFTVDGTYCHMTEHGPVRTVRAQKPTRHRQRYSDPDSRGQSRTCRWREKAVHGFESVVDAVISNNIELFETPIIRLNSHLVTIESFPTAAR